VVCREVMKLKLDRRGAAEVVALSAVHAVHAMAESRSASEGGPDKFATRLATRPGQLPVYAMKSILALPGFEVRPGAVDSAFQFFARAHNA